MTMTCFPMAAPPNRSVTSVVVDFLSNGWFPFTLEAFPIITSTLKTIVINCEQHGSTSITSDGNTLPTSFLCTHKKR